MDALEDKKDGGVGHWRGSNEMRIFSLTHLVRAQSLISGPGHVRLPSLGLSSMTCVASEKLEIGEVGVSASFFGVTLSKAYIYLGFVIFFLDGRDIRKGVAYSPIGGWSGRENKGKNRSDANRVRPRVTDPSVPKIAMFPRRISAHSSSSSFG